MSENSVCRVCLTVGVRMLRILDTPLQLVYEKLVTTELRSVGRPVAACYICCARLYKSYQLMLMADQAETVLTSMLAKCSKVSVRSVSKVDRRAAGLCGSLTISPTELTDSPPPVKAEINMEEEPEIIIEYQKDEPNCSESPEAASGDDDMSASEDDDPLSLVASQPAKVMKMEAELQPKGDGGFGEKSETKKRTRTADTSHEKRVAGRGPARTVRRGRQCNVCHKYDTNLNRHMRTHTGEKPHQCNICQKTYIRLEQLKFHLRTHTGEGTYECNICQKSFSALKYLNKHLRTHTSEKPFECHVCRSRFSQKQYLKYHLITHTGEKPYECDACHKRFYRKQNLLNHLRTHTGEKPYECDVCHSRFSIIGHLKNHLRRHTGEKPYECNVCHNTFNSLTSLKRHFKIHIEIK